MDTPKWWSASDFGVACFQSNPNMAEWFAITRGSVMRPLILGHVPNLTVQLVAVMLRKPSPTISNRKSCSKHYSGLPQFSSGQRRDTNSIFCSTTTNDDRVALQSPSPAVPVGWLFHVSVRCQKLSDSQVESGAVFIQGKFIENRPVGHKP